MVEFNFQAPATLRNRNPLKQFLVKLAKREGKRLESLSVVICDDKYLLKINREYLGHNDFTDIITFDYSGEKGVVSGELYISIDRIRENAKTFNTTAERETHRVIFHGLLHLCGVGDKTATEKAMMRTKEEHYLSRYFKSST